MASQPTIENTFVKTQRFTMGMPSAKGNRSNSDEAPLKAFVKTHWRKRRGLSWGCQMQREIAGTLLCLEDLAKKGYNKDKGFRKDRVVAPHCVCEFQEDRKDHVLCP
ncbi:hypothetical protein AMTR_s00007p00186850 [Amborella trichopoda]|uniref:Uncharacterized protein n=1 Tax=Amborella trichopoda TaxID=13333 RepID=W1PCJ3_AMBTC|nr:hypothetical protein AMTR_s00007p00186850 [Amborella trichopoda]